MSTAKEPTSAAHDTSNNAPADVDHQVIVVRFRTQQLSIPLPLGACLKDLKHKIHEQADVAPEDQKLLGIVVKHDDDVLPRITKKLMLMVTAKPPPPSTTPIEQQLYDTAGAQEDEEDNTAGLLEDITNDPDDVRRALERRITSTEVTILTPPRPGAHCLVCIMAVYGEDLLVLRPASPVFFVLCTPTPAHPTQKHPIYKKTTGPGH